ncbi:hypothetical protein LNQ52_22815 [Klebsiella pneumoniae subsp. pneumoniae]|nr:hypothetical protein [Klebsiella pneumoniae subsp. pneumoniae]
MAGLVSCRKKASRSSPARRIFPLFVAILQVKNDIDGMTALLGKALKPIPVNETLLDLFTAAKTSAVY